MNEPERWFSVEEIAKHLGVSKETIYRWVEKKKIPSHKLGRQWKFQVSEVDEWVRRGEASDSSFSKKESCSSVNEVFNGSLV